MNTNMKVLIVDDYKTMLRIVRNLLNQIGFKDIDEATDGQMALGMFQKTNYGLVISDWNMEPMSGYDFLKGVRGGAHNTSEERRRVYLKFQLKAFLAARRSKAASRSNRALCWHSDTPNSNRGR